MAGEGNFSHENNETPQEGGMLRRGRQARIGQTPIGKLEEAAARGMEISYDADASTKAGEPVAQVDKKVVSGNLPPVDRRSAWQKFKDLFKK